MIPCAKYEKEFRAAHPETVGEKDAHFDLANYAEWLEKRIDALLAPPPRDVVEVPERAAWLTIEEIAEVVQKCLADYALHPTRSLALHAARSIACASMDKGGRTASPTAPARPDVVEVPRGHARVISQMLSLEPMRYGSDEYLAREALEHAISAGERNG